MCPLGVPEDLYISIRHEGKAEERRNLIQKPGLFAGVIWEWGFVVGVRLSLGLFCVCDKLMNKCVFW